MAGAPGFYQYPEDKVDTQDLQDRVSQRCRLIANLMGYESFHVKSTERQFKRYRDRWHKDAWRPIVEAALKVLNDPSVNDVET